MSSCKCNCNCGCVNDNKDTIDLLKEVNSGCKSATNSCEQVLSYVKDEKLKKLVEKVNKEHIEIGDKCHSLLNSMNEDEKDPSKLASAMSWFETELKLMVNADTSKIAGMLMDGCNMGIKSIGKYVNQYPNASKDCINLAEKLIKIEEGFMSDLKEFL